MIDNQPELFSWVPTEEQKYFVYENDIVRAKYEEILGLEAGTILSSFLIIKNHYKDRMEDIVHHINYFLNFYDTEKELFLSVLSIKFLIDQNNTIKKKNFRELVVNRVITDSLVEKIKKMARDLYVLNIDTDSEGKFKTTPKITNDQARQIVALSFCFRMIIPLCVHFSNTNIGFPGKKDYISAFDKIFMDIIKKFEKDDIKIFYPLSRFIKYQIDRTHNANKGTWIQKKQLYGHTKDLYIEEVIHEVIIVKTIHKLKYNQSCVSFIDGVLFNYSYNYRQENYKYKPLEIDTKESVNDSDDYFSQLELLEMRVFKLDESIVLINDANNNLILEKIYEKFNIPIEDAELEFYKKNCKLNMVNQFFLRMFYARFFDSSNALDALNADTTFKLLIYMKKYLHLKGMSILPQMCTARIYGKYKDKSIRNSKFLEKISTSSVYENIISNKFRYVRELNLKEDPIIKQLSILLNSSFEFVDYDDNIDGILYDNINVDIVAEEFLVFLSII